MGMTLYPKVMSAFFVGSHFKFGVHDRIPILKQLKSNVKTYKVFQSQSWASLH